MVDDNPISHEGNHWTLDKAFLGAAKQHRPQIWGLGGGPKILDLSTSYGDGFAGAAPCVWATPDDAAEYIGNLKKQVASKGKDPDQYRVGALCPVLVHEVEAVLDRALDNKVVRWIGAIFGGYATPGLAPGRHRAGGTRRVDLFHEDEAGMTHRRRSSTR